MNAVPPIRAFPAVVVRYLKGEESVERAAVAYVEFLDSVFHAKVPDGLVDYQISDADAPKMLALLAQSERYGIERDARSYLSTAADSKFDRNVRLLAADVKATIGQRHLLVVWSTAAHVVELANEIQLRDPTGKCVEEVQQYLQDTFVDTTWPACPKHPNHPLEYEDYTWRCPRNRAVIAQLGALGETRH